jgi:hypothetical protein
MMSEFDIYLPVAHNDGSPVSAEMIQGVKDTLAREFGGYTHFNQRNDGSWSMGGVVFRDEVTVVRVLDDGSANFDMKAYKKHLEELFAQRSILIVRRSVEVLG